MGVPVRRPNYHPPGTVRCTQPISAERLCRQKDCYRHHTLRPLRRLAATGAAMARPLCNRNMLVPSGAGARRRMTGSALTSESEITILPNGDPLPPKTDDRASSGRKTRRIALTNPFSDLTPRNLAASAPPRGLTAVRRRRGRRRFSRKASPRRPLGADRDRAGRTDDDHHGAHSERGARVRAEAQRQTQHLLFGQPDQDGDDQEGEQDRHLRGGICSRRSRPSRG